MKFKQYSKFYKDMWSVDTSIMLVLRRMIMSLIMSLADFCLTGSLREECGHHLSQGGMGMGGQSHSLLSQFTPVLITCSL